jgi:succinate dehydrogenase / fumarate reductase flavoprotein subunit
LNQQAYLDMTALPDEIFRTRLSETLDNCLTYLRLDPRREPIPIAPGIHYFMGGIQVDDRHKTALPGLYAAGECCCQYHGANRLGGNSLLDAIYGGITAVNTAIADGFSPESGEFVPADTEQTASDKIAAQNVVRNALGVSRDHAGLKSGIAALKNMQGSIPLLGRAILTGALERRESRGAHLRSDYPEQNDADFRRTTVVSFDGKDISARFEPISGMR